MTFDKNKVYTALNADEVKVGSTGCFADTFAELKENVEDREIYKLTGILFSEEDYRFEMRSIKNLHFRFFYLVEEPQEEKYRPYEDSDEMIEDFKERAKKHYNANFFKCPMFHTSIWVKAKERTVKSLVYVFYPRSVYVGDEEEMPLDKLFEYYTYLDGTPCGKKIE
jgi:hypothetical protein